MMDENRQNGWAPRSAPANKRTGSFVAALIFFFLALLCTAVGTFLFAAYLNSIVSDPTGTEGIGNVVMWFMQTFVFSLPLLAGFAFSVLGIVFGALSSRSSVMATKIIGIIVLIVCILMLLACSVMMFYGFVSIGSM